VILCGRVHTRTSLSHSDVDANLPDTDELVDKSVREDDFSRCEGGCGVITLCDVMLRTISHCSRLAA
jgi:hypothetical protein